jgi:hypothetical protein
MGPNVWLAYGWRTGGFSVGAHVEDAGNGLAPVVSHNSPHEPIPLGKREKGPKGKRKGKGGKRREKEGKGGKRREKEGKGGKRREKEGKGGKRREKGPGSSYLGKGGKRGLARVICELFELFELFGLELFEELQEALCGIALGARDQAGHSRRAVRGFRNPHFRLDQLARHAAPLPPVQ